MEKMVKELEIGFQKFWFDKNVLITGVAGFIGSHLAASLLKFNANVVGLIRDKLPVSYFKILDIESKITTVQGKLEDIAFLERIISQYKIDYIFHLGAQAIVSFANQLPLPTFVSNIEGTWCLLDAVRRLGCVKGVVVASSDKAYGQHSSLPYREDFPLNPSFPYDISKACADLISRGYNSTYGLPITVLRCANTYGPGDLNLSRIIPDTIQNLLFDRNPIIRSDGKSIRDFLYIDDAVRAYLLLGMSVAKPNVQGQAFNAGTNLPMAVLNVVEKLIKISAKNRCKSTILGKSTPQGEIDCQYLDSTKIYKAVGWQFTTSIDEGLRITWDWWVSNWNILKEL